MFGIFVVVGFILIQQLFARTILSLPQNIACVAKDKAHEALHCYSSVTGLSCN